MPVGDYSTKGKGTWASRALRDEWADALTKGEWPNPKLRGAWADALTQSAGLSIAQSAVLRRVMDRAGDRRIACTESIKAMALRIGMSRSTAITALNFLICSGFIVWELGAKGQGYANTLRPVVGVEPQVLAAKARGGCP